PITSAPNVNAAQYTHPLSARPNTSSGNPAIHLFQGQPDGALPYDGPLNVKGTLYGTTYAGGANNLGAVFSVSPGGSEKILYSFSGSDGEYPYASLVYVKGKLYGTTYQGGAKGAGTVFSLTRAGKEKVLYSFTGGSDGSLPDAVLCYHKGALYGTTYSGGANGLGAVFKITLAGKESVLYSLKGQPSDGQGPEAGVIYYKGAFYGTAVGGGMSSGGEGTVFKVTPSGKGSVLHTFTGSPDGSEPVGDLMAYGGNLYGTTSKGGSYDGGTVFKITPAGKLSIICSFGAPGSGDDEVGPQAGLINVNGTFYGTVEGANVGGAVFSITPTGAESFVYEFNRNGPQGTPIAPLGRLAEIKGTLYGTSLSNVGPGGYGTVFAVPL
ncbi:MAG: choice-of-anchor tandem repeat GloVer-containing protein, partial [Candidatus Cybelea sp.]